MFCGRCGNSNTEGASFCQTCGAPLRVAAGPAAPVGNGIPPDERTAPTASALIKYCGRCGTPHAEGSRFCQSCGNVLQSAGAAGNPLQANGLPSTNRVVALPDPGSGAYGGFWVRFVAYILDNVILGVIQVIAIAIFLETDNMNGTRVSLLQLLIIMIYDVSCPVLFGAHPGKLAFGFRIVDEKGRRIGWGKSFSRFLAWIVSFLVLFLGFLAIAFDDRKQGWHDKIAGTFVIKARYIAPDS